MHLRPSEGGLSLLNAVHSNMLNIISLMALNFISDFAENLGSLICVITSISKVKII